MARLRLQPGVLSVSIVGGLVVFAPLIDGGTTHLPVLIIRLILLAALMAWVAAAMRGGRLVVYPTSLFLPVAVLIGWATLSVAWSPYQAAGIQWLLSLFSYTALLFLALHLVESTKQVRWLVTIVLGMGIFEAALGMYQFLWGEQSRATGTFFNPNFFASYEMAVFSVALGLLCYGYRRQSVSGQDVPLTLALSLQGRGKEIVQDAQREAPRSPLALSFQGRGKEIGEKVCLWLAAGMTGVAFVLAQSRGALLGLVAAVGFVGLYRFGKRFLAVLALCLVIGWIVPNPLHQRIMTIGTQDPYAYTRVEIWNNALQRLSDHPFGVGLGQYKYTSFQYRFPLEGEIVRYGKRAESAHSGYLQVAVELGVPGLAIVLVGAGLLGREIFETLRLDLDPVERGVVTGMSGGLLGLLVHAAVDSLLHEPALMVLLTLCAGVILAIKRVKTVPAPSPLVIPFAYHPARATLVGALAILSVLLVVRPAAAWHVFDRGEAAMRTGQVEAARNWYQWATQIDPGVTAYHDAVARSAITRYQQNGDARHLREAVDEFSLALALNPLDARLAHRLGNSYALLAGAVAGTDDGGVPRDEILRLAATAYEQAMRLDPYSPFGYFELGRLREAQGQRDQAEALFRTALEQEPNFLPARVRLVEIALYNGMNNEMNEAAASEYAIILAIQEQYKGRTLNALEHQYLVVDLNRLKQLFVGGMANGAPRRAQRKGPTGVP